MKRPPRACLLLLIHALLVRPARAADAAEISLPDRIAAARALERVRHANRIRTTAAGDRRDAFDAEVPEAATRRQVEEMLRRSAALERRYGRPVTGGDLRAELERMARDSKNPQRLRDYFAALGDDPVRIAETLVRPIVTEARIREAFRGDGSIHARARAAAEGAVARYGFTERLRESDAEWIEFTLPDGGDGPGGGAPDAFAGTAARNARGANAGIVEDETAFRVTVMLDSTPGSMRVGLATWPKVSFDAWWDGVREQYPVDERVLAPDSMPLPPLSAAACGAPDAWSPITMNNAPAGRTDAAAIWTGSEMIVWGGYYQLYTGGRYDPATDAWAATTTAGAPAGRSLHTAVWTGSVAIFWGGSNSGNVRNDGGRYNPATDSWSGTSTGANVPSARHYHTAIWTGSRMIVWGGYGSAGNLNTGGQYDPVADAWSATSTADAPVGRNLHTAVWSGTQMLVWGGRTGYEFWWSGPRFDGGRYDPATDAWLPMNGVNGPNTAMPAAATWACNQMVVWGGTYNGCDQVRNGSRYFPVTDSWSRMSTSGAPVHRDVYASNFVRIGSHELMFFGGDCAYYHSGNYGDGGRYDVASDTWGPVSATGAPAPRRYHVTVGAGNQAIVWGGSTGGAQGNGAVYCSSVAPACAFVDTLGCPMTLAAVGSAAPASVPQTGQATLSYAITNTQSACTGPVTATTTLPAGFTFISGPPSADCTAAGSVVTCTLASLPAGSGATTLDLVVRVGTGTGAVSVPLALATFAGPAGGGAAAVTVVPGADLVVTKTPSSAWPVTGAPMTWTITVTNNGPAAAASVVVADPVPSGLSAVRDTAAADFASGTHAGTRWNATSAAVELDNNPAALPNNQSAADFVDMTGNRLLLHMDETAWTGTAGQVVDSSGSGNHGASAGSAVANANGKLARAGQFNGTSSYVKVPHNANLNPTTELTVSLWVRRDDNVSDRKLIGKSSTNAGVTTGWILGTWQNAGSACYPEIFDTANTRYSFGAGAITQGKWAHLAFTWKTGGRMRGYVDGAMVADIAAGPNPIASNTMPVFLGTMPWFDPPTGGYLNGGLDEVAVWTRELSPAEIATIYRRQAAAGKFDSRVLDTGSTHTISKVAFRPGFPAGRALPDGGVSETGYPSGNANMTGNQFLMHLDDAPGATAFAESSGNALNGLCTGAACPTQIASGRTGSAFNFDGGDTITLTATTGIPATGAFTIEAWIRPAQISGINGIVGWGKFGVSNSVNVLALWGSCTGGAILANIWNNGAEFTACATGIAVGKWSHVAATYDGNWVRRLYVDGVQIGSAGSIPNYNAPPSTLFVLGRTGSTANFFVGSIDEVAIWNRPLSAAEVRDHYLRGVTTLGLQVASCPDAACAAPVFKGPDGTSNSSWLASSAGAAPPAFNVAGIAPSRWYRYRATLGCERPVDSPALVSAELDLVPGVVSSAGSCTVANSDVTCSLGTLAAGASATVTVTSGSLVPGPFTNHATAASAVADPIPSSNTGSAAVTVLASGGDDDGDGVINRDDCRPLDGGVFASPTPARDLGVDKFAGMTLEWSAPAAPGGGALVYDVLRSGAAAGFSGAICAAGGINVTTAVDATVPPASAFYLVRARNACGSTLGADSSGAPRSAPACP